MKKLKPFLRVLTVLALIPVVQACSTDLSITSSAVGDRFQESIDGKTKPIVLPRVKDPRHFSFLWLTDMHIRPDKKDYFDKLGNFATKSHASFVITSGDITDEGTSEDYDEVVFKAKQNLPVPLYSALGNHDLYNDGWDEFKDNIGPSTAVFKFGNTMFMIIDTATCEVGADQMDWIEDKLDDVDAKHKIIFSHICLYNRTAELPIILCDPDERARLLGLLKKYEVEYFLCGHGHYAEVTKADGTTHIQGATASAWNNPLNGDPEFFNFIINGADLDYERYYFKDY